jgi:hypothetical protein
MQSSKERSPMTIMNAARGEWECRNGGMKTSSCTKLVILDIGNANQDVRGRV